MMNDESHTHTHKLTETQETCAVAMWRTNKTTYCTYVNVSAGVALCRSHVSRASRTLQFNSKTKSNSNRSCDTFKRVYYVLIIYFTCESYRALLSMHKKTIYRFSSYIFLFIILTVVEKTVSSGCGYNMYIVKSEHHATVQYDSATNQITTYLIFCKFITIYPCFNFHQFYPRLRINKLFHLLQI